jgi:hypothetical protein
MEEDEKETMAVADGLSDGARALAFARSSRLTILVYTFFTTPLSWRAKCSRSILQGS